MIYYNTILEVIAELNSEILEHPSYCPDFAINDCFEYFKITVCGTLKRKMWKILEICAATWKKSIERQGCHLENSLFLKFFI